MADVGVPAYGASTVNRLSVKSQSDCKFDSSIVAELSPFSERYAAIGMATVLAFNS